MFRNNNNGNRQNFDYRSPQNQRFPPPFAIPDIYPGGQYIPHDVYRDRSPLGAPNMSPQQRFGGSHGSPDVGFRHNFGRGPRGSPYSNSNSPYDNFTSPYMSTPNSSNGRGRNKRFFPEQQHSPHHQDCNPGGDADIRRYYSPSMTQDPWAAMMPLPSANKA